MHRRYFLMGRVLKFRAWDKNLKEIIPVHNIDFVKRMINTESAWRSFNEIELMQYTGLKDDHDTAIYENDVLYDPITNSFYVVTWDDSYAMFFMKNTKDDPNLTDYDFAEFDVDVCNSLYVVGNIHENPELLAGEK
jgi:uncharacterized phage protein (TIGR01671 family)